MLQQLLTIVGLSTINIKAKHIHIHPHKHTHTHIYIHILIEINAFITFKQCNTQKREWKYIYLDMLKLQHFVAHFNCCQSLSLLLLVLLVLLLLLLFLLIVLVVDVLNCTEFYIFFFIFYKNVWEFLFRIQSLIL